MAWQLVETDDALRDLLARHRDAEAVIIDTEFMRRNTFFPRVALVQLCFSSEEPGRETAWLIDPLRIADPAPLRDLLSSKAVTKVLHSASEDLEVFQRWPGVLPQPLFDTQRAAGLLNIGFGLGYRALVGAICDVDLPKGETCSDWLQRPLTPSQCDYAEQDVIWLLRVWRELHRRCLQQEKLQWVLDDGSDAVTALAAGPGDTWQRIKSAWKLDRRQLGILAAVCRWREDLARTRDKPRGWILDDQACQRLAELDPRTMAQLRDAAQLPDGLVRRHGEQLLSLLAAQREVPESGLPPRPPAPLDAAGRAQVKKLKARAEAIAEGLSVAPQALLQGKDCELLLREACGEVFPAPAHWRGWRGALVVDPLRAYLAGGVA